MRFGLTNYTERDTNHTKQFNFHSMSCFFCQFPNTQFINFVLISSNRLKSCKINITMTLAKLAHILSALNKLKSCGYDELIVYFYLLRFYNNVNNRHYWFTLITQFIRSDLSSFKFKISTLFFIILEKQHVKSCLLLYFKYVSIRSQIALSTVLKIL